MGDFFHVFLSLRAYWLCDSANGGKIFTCFHHQWSPQVTCGSWTFSDNILIFLTMLLNILPDNILDFWSWYIHIFVMFSVRVLGLQKLRWRKSFKRIYSINRGSHFRRLSRWRIHRSKIRSLRHRGEAGLAAAGLTVERTSVGGNQKKVWGWRRHWRQKFTGGRSTKKTLSALAVVTTPAAQSGHELRVKYGLTTVVNEEQVCCAGNSLLDTMHSISAKIKAHWNKKHRITSKE